MAANVKDFPRIPPGTRRSSEIRQAWGSRPPTKLPRTPFTFWDGTSIPGGVNPLTIAAVTWLDHIFQRHSYPLGNYAAGDDWCYNLRKTKHGGVWSLHSWAIAVDINATTNPFSKRFVTDFTPQIIADVQAVRHPNGRPAWQWGGTWGLNANSSFDPMHFQIGLTPEECRSLPGPTPHAPPAPVPAPPPVPRDPTDPGIDVGGLVGSLAAATERIGDLERKVDVLAGLLGGMDFATMALWLLRAAIGKDPDPAAVEAVAAQFAAGVPPEHVYRQLVKGP